MDTRGFQTLSSTHSSQGEQVEDTQLRFIVLHLVQEFVKHLDVFTFVEGIIYQRDEENEQACRMLDAEIPHKAAKQGSTC